MINDKNVQYNKNENVGGSCNFLRIDKRYLLLLTHVKITPAVGITLNIS